MAINPRQSALHAELNKVNRRFADHARQLYEHLVSPGSREVLERIWSVFLSPEPWSRERLDTAAEAFVSILNLHPSLPGEPISRVGRPIFPDQPGYSSATGEEAGRLLLLGSLYLGIADRTDEASQRRLWEIIAGADTVNTLLRDFFSCKPLSPKPLIPQHLIDFSRDLYRRSCVLGIQHALAQFGMAAHAWRVTSHANGITSLDPPRGCAGQRVTILGAGFGNLQPQGVEVYFPTKSGSCKPAQVRPNGWTDTAIEVDLPADVGIGCVGFVVHGSGEGPTLAEAASTLVGEVGSCLGPFAAAAMMSGGFNTLTTGGIPIPCPPCLPGDANRFIGGPPVIHYFVGTRHRQTQRDTSVIVDLMPGDSLELSWRVENATQVQIVTISVNGQMHELPAVAGPFDPAQGNLLVRWLANNPLALATFTWIAGYELRASNACGSVVSRITVRMRSGLKPTAPTAPYWGVATAGRQVEGNLSVDDWEIFTTDPQILQRLQIFKQQHNLSINPESAGVALNHRILMEFIDSVERAKALGLNAYRFSIEWSRVEPTSGNYDSRALADYQAMVDAVRARGMEPFVVLNHLSLPAWVLTPPRQTAAFTLPPRPFSVFSVVLGGDDSDPGYQASLRGWETTATVDAYVRYVEYVVTRLRDVRFWITLNEPLGTTVPTGYLAGVFPPGFFADGWKAKSAIHNLILAHAHAYEAICAINPNAQVGIADQWLYCKPNLGWKATENFVYYHQDFLINALVHGNEDVDISIDKPRYERVLGIPEADWRPHLDFFGLQYYKSVYPYHFPPIALRAPWLGAKVDLDLKAVNYPHQLLNDMGWEMCPEGLYESLMKLKRIANFNGQDLPILVAENGTAEIVDHNRSAFVTGHLEQMQRAQQDGANIFGYLHWSIADNWEWIEGYRQEARFGLFSVNRSASGLPHSITDGALAVAYIMENPGTRVAAAVSRFGRYRPDGAVVEHPSMSPHATFQGTLDGQPITLLLAAPPAFPVPAPVRYTSLIGLLFYGESQRWVRLESIVWEPATRTLQFSHPEFGGRTPEQVFAGTLDPTGQHFIGTASEVSGIGVVAGNCQLSRAAFAGMWQARLTSGAVITLSLSCPEGIWHGRVLGARGPQDWSPLESLTVLATGLTATEPSRIIVWGSGITVTASSRSVAATLDAANNLIVPTWGVSLQRLPDGLPF